MVQAKPILVEISCLTGLFMCYVVGLFSLFCAHTARLLCGHPPAPLIIKEIGMLRKGSKAAIDGI